MKSYVYGFPRLGKNKEFKKTLEAFWAGKISQEETQKALDEIQREIITFYSNMDYYPVGEITGYDNILDAAIMLGIYSKPSNLNDYYSLVRGKNALPIKKWFNTNYHYVVPTIDNYNFKLSWNKPLEEYKKNKSPKAVPFVVGPFTLIKLSKGIKDYSLLANSLSKVYSQIIETLTSEGAPFIHIDEPALVFELTEEERNFINTVYSEIAKKGNLLVITYYDDIERETLETILKTPIWGIGVDTIRNGKNTIENLKNLKNLIKDKILVLGVVDGRTVWKDDIKRISQKISDIENSIPAKEIWISNAGPLFHLPYTVENEENLDPSIKERLAFAIEKIKEINHIRSYINGDKTVEEWNNYKHNNSHWFNKEVQERVRNLKESDFSREKPYKERIKIQDEILKLPIFPTTTIGSFPQTEEVRQMRQKYKKGEISKEEYQNFIKQKIQDAIKIQEELGIDVLVHGEFERSDMVEYFAEKLEGITTTENGWVISYGTRVYRPPIIYGDIYRNQNLVLDEILYAQSLTKKPVKAILTGPTTILAWSYERTDIPEKETAFQIALAINDEIKELEKNNIKVIQIDEPAFREKAPIKKRDWKEYFDWSIKAFKLSSKTKPEVQLHTHMCYSEFSEIIDKIYELDADVISIETSRSGGNLIEAFENFNYDHQIGLGIYDVHSPEIPSIDTMEKVVLRALKVIDPKNFWINPDCGLKTRKWEEVIPSLKNMIELAKQLREKFKNS
ncbi:MAG: 5-methyltetrahydropteroyltriglutamate--homocysteine S-methyltransferase [Brevinematia bacterium]